MATSPRAAEIPILTMNIQQIKIEQLTVHEHHLDIRYSADAFYFSTKVFYHDLSFSRLVDTYSQAAIDRVVAGIALFEGMKLCSLFPKTFDISLIASALDAHILALFPQIYAGVFAQHWYENNVTDYRGPDLIFPAGTLGPVQTIAIANPKDTILAGCGGGKDSIVALKILENAGVPFASMQYSHSVYGKADQQHALIDQVVAHTTPTQAHQISIFEDFLDDPFLSLYFPENSGIIAPETPVSIFESLPLILSQGYRYLSLAHERSANTGNLFWDTLGQDVNHQWGKGFAAEQAMNHYVQTYLIPEFHYFSLLQPIYDRRIFQVLTQFPEVLPDIHSCNIKKPWCKKCPKCAYVWLGLMSVFEPALVDEVFGYNLFDDEALLPIFRDMIGLSEHTPFECIGEIDESRLAMKACVEKGLSGRALDLFKSEVLTDVSIDWSALTQKYDQVYRSEHAIPDWLYAKVAHLL